MYTSSSSQVHLQPAIEELIKKICKEKCIQPPDVTSRQLLLTLTESEAIDMLNNFASLTSIRSFSSFVTQTVTEMMTVEMSLEDNDDVVFVASSQKRSVPFCSPLIDGTPPLKCARKVSPNSQQFVGSPCSSSKRRTIPDYFSGSKRNNGTWHLAESSMDINRVQKQLIFPPGCNVEDANYSMVKPHSFESSNASRRFSVVQNKQTLSPCSTLNGTSLKQFPEFSSATNNGSFGVPTPDNLERPLGFKTPNYSKSQNSLAVSVTSLLLAELEFRKLFMLHCYVGRKKLEDVISVDDAIEIKKMNSMSMIDFEAKIWAKYGLKNCKSSDRAMYLDWDCGKTYLYYCYLNADGDYQFKGPFLNTRRTHLQRELGDDNVLIVQFIDDPNTHDMSYNCANWSSAYEIISQGIPIGVRHYRLFAFKDGRDNKNHKDTKKLRSTWAVKCYFIRTESHAPWVEKDDYLLFKKTSHEARCLFMHVHMVSSMAKYISRCSLALSNTIKLRYDLSSVTVERIEDIPCRNENGFVVCDEDGEPLIHTDGTGFISEDLAILCAKDFIEAKSAKDDSNEIEDLLLGSKGMEACFTEPPLLVQCRLFKDGYAVKGTLLVNKKLKDRTIQIRPSMIKVEKDNKFSESTSFSSLEIVSISRKPRKTNLSKNLIALLTVGGVPKDYFLNLLETTLQETQKAFTDTRSAARVALNYEQIDDSATSVAMLGSGIPIEEPYLQYRLSILANEERKGLRSGKIPISESFYLIGTADPTGTLNSDEVCIILETGQMSGKWLVYRNPGLHFGDIHILNAIYVQKLEEFVGNAKYGIFFSTKGRRSVGSEIANGDFDGDLYWVSRSPQLLHYFKVSEPWQRIYSTPNAPSKKPSDLSHEELENELVTLLFSTQKQNMVAGKAADSWHTFMDQYLSLGEDDVDKKNRIKEKLLQLVDLYYDALDAPKSGKTVEIPKSLLPQKYPHYLEKRPDKSFHSSSVLGEIYDNAKEYRADNASTQVIWKLPCFDDVEIPVAYLKLWHDRYASYKLEMTSAMTSGDESKNDSANTVIKKYKQMLYEAEDFASSNRKLEDIYYESLAIYNSSYDHAWKNSEVSKCGFAWKVAGEALCYFHSMKTPGRSISCKVDFLSMLI